jgi:hypothetical protein
MNNLTLLLVITVVLIFIYVRTPAPKEESFIDIVEKRVPRENVASPIIIDAIPLNEPAEQIEATDPPIRAIMNADKPPIALTFDASVARNALMRSRDKRVFDAIANRTTEYYRPFYEEELNRNEYRDWWDDVSYPINEESNFEDFQYHPK